MGQTKLNILYRTLRPIFKILFKRMLAAAASSKGYSEQKKKEKSFFRWGAVGLLTINK